MKTAQSQILVIFFITIATVVVYRVVNSEMLNADLRQARIAYETEKLQAEREHLKRSAAFEEERLRVKRASIARYDDLTYYGIIGALGMGGLTACILAVGHTRAKMRQASVYIARIGEHSEIPIHQKDLQRFYPIAVNLSLAEIEASASAAHDQAYRISRQMLADITEYTRALAGKGDTLALDADRGEQPQFALPALTATPTFADLLRTGQIAAGKPLIIGYDRQGQPQYRTLYDLKSVAVAGWQGSGKTLSMGYLVASSVLAYGVQVYVIDPHKHHPESLSALIQPLEATGQVTVINPFDTPALLEELNQRLDRRLAGQEPSDPGILLVIDEMARLANMECFEVLVKFLERCTEETRKANITFIGGSPKWTARHFKGRADIRACMNSMLIHKTKPSQADLLLEDAHDKHLVKQLQRPGEVILVTDYAAPMLVTIPFCTRNDMTTVAALLGHSEIPRHAPFEQGDLTSSPPDFKGGPGGSEEESPDGHPHVSSSGVIPLARHRKPDPGQLTVEMLQAQVEHLKTHNPTLTQAELARQAGISQSYFSRILKGQSPLTEKQKQKLTAVLFGTRDHQPAFEVARHFRVLNLRKTAG